MVEQEFNGKSIVDIFNKMIFLERKRILEFEGIRLYPSEAHMILLISREGSTNATLMAEALGVTKGAVSQTLTRLEEKGILVKEKDPYNKNELTVHLTPLGQQAYDRFRQVQDHLLSRFDSYLCGLTQGEREVIRRFFENMEGTMSTI